MTVTGPERPPGPLDVAKQHVEQALDPRIAKRLETYKDGTFYVRAGAWAVLLAWLVDVVVCLLGVLIVVVAVAAAKRDLSDETITLVLLGLLVGMPLVYGLFYGDGRCLGAVFTGIRKVRGTNGQRIGASASWAMLLRTLLLPLLIVLFLVVMIAAAAGGSGSAGGGGKPASGPRRVNIDDDATRRLHAAGFLRLPGT